MIHKSVYKHIEPEEFYRLYNLVRTYFTGSYDEYRSLLKSDTVDRYRRDNLKTFYDNIALRVSDAEDAMLIILSNIIDNENSYINSFDIDSIYYNDLLRYSTNKFAILEDFTELCQHVNVTDKINTGVLADEVIRLRQDFVLFAYINKIVQIVDISIKNQSIPETVELTYGEIVCSMSDDSGDIITKVAAFLTLSSDELSFLKPRIEEILELNKNMTTFEDSYLSDEELYNIGYIELHNNH